MANTTKGSSKLRIHSKYNRYFSESFKRAKVKELEAGLLSIKELSEQYEVSRTSIYKWVYKYSPHHSRGSRQVIEMKSEAHKTKLLKARVSELERIIGQKQLELDYLNKLIELASEDLGYDLKKNIEQKRSNTSVNSGPKDTK